MKFIISPRTDKLTGKTLIEGHRANSDANIEDIIYNILKTFEADLALTSTEAMDRVLALLVDQTLQIRLYVKDFFHAKAYLARTIHDDIHNYYSIVGSSNFSAGGLTDNRELNLGTSEGHNYKALSVWFDDLWVNHTSDFNAALIQIVQSNAKTRKAGGAPVLAMSPWEMFLFLSRYYLGNLASEEMKESDQLAEFQRVGAENILNKLEFLGGAIVSDSVGLGKTYTAGEVIRRYRAENKKTLVVAPPTLLDQWKNTLEESFGMKESPFLSFLSQGKLSQMSESELAKKRGEKYALIVVDEAHRARNSGSYLHRNLNSLHPHGQERSRVLLLTATPFNNSVLDLYNLMGLVTTKAMLSNAGFYPESFVQFAKMVRDARRNNSTGSLDKNLDYIKQRRRIQEILNAIMLLRMRSTIKNRYGNIAIAGKPLRFEDPEVSKVAYSYGNEHHALFQNLGEFLQKLHLPHIRLANPSSGTLSALYQLLLFKRIESSLYAFYISLENIKKREESLLEDINHLGMEKVIEKYNESLLESEEADLLLQSKSSQDDEPLEPISEKDVRDWIQSDIQEVNNFIKIYLLPLRRNPADPMSLTDPKVDCFIDSLSGGLFRKALTFTEYRATAEYLNFHLEKAKNAGKLRLRFAITTASDRDLSKKLDRFAPVGRKAEVAGADELDLLVSTDVLSEGVNLQDADLLINFDLPWNPMRIVQRVGRVNRIGSENKVRVLNFAPDQALDQFLNLLEILTGKIRQVAALLGKEMAILSGDEETIDPRDIGEELKKIRSAKHVSEWEESARNKSLLSMIEGETDEDFFKMKLFLSLRENHVRPEDFHDLPERHYERYCITNETPEKIFGLFEIRGKRDSHDDLLSRFWLCAAAGKVTEEYPDAFLQKDVIRQSNKSYSSLKDVNFIHGLENSLTVRYQEILSERRELNTQRNLGKRLQSSGGLQAILITQLEKLLTEKRLDGHDFLTVAEGLRQDASVLLDDLNMVLRTNVIGNVDIARLRRALQEKNIDPTKELSPPSYLDFAQILLDFYGQQIAADASLRGQIYKKSEIYGRKIATVYF